MDRILQYEIARKLGEGENGSAYLAVDSGLQRAVVVKTFEKSKLIGDESRRSAFLEQTERINTLNNTGIAQFYSVEEDDSNWIVVREYIEGQTVADLVRSGSFGYARWLETVLQVSRTLKVIHDAGQAHGNVTSTNIFITANGKARLTDFGLGESGVRGDSIENDHGVDKLADGAGAVGDLYALGEVLFFMMAGRMPEWSAGKSWDALFDGVSETRVPGVARLLIKRLMAPETKDRLGSVDELILTLQGIISLGTEQQDAPHSGRWSLSPRQYLMLAMFVLLLIILWLAITSNPR